VRRWTLLSDASAPARNARGEWHPAGAGDSLVIDLPALFRDALDE
jgi:hypothetical protein